MFAAKWIGIGIIVLGFCSSAARADFSFIIGDYTYRVVTTKRTWSAAAADAVKQKVVGVPGALARIDDKAEDDAILAQLLAHIPSSDFSKTTPSDGGGGAYIWIGGTDRKKEGTWLWDGDNDGVGDQFWSGKGTGGSPVGGLFFGWGVISGRQVEPDDFNSSQDAAGMSLNGWPFGVRGQWNDVGENNSLYYIIEFAAVPEPGMGVMAICGVWVLTQRLRSKTI